MDITFFAGVEYKDKVIFSCMYFNALCEYDLKTNHIRLIGLFEKEKMISRLHSTAFLYGSSAWFVPQRGEYIVCVDLNTYSMEYFDVPYTYKNEEENKYTYHVFSEGSKLKQEYVCLVPVDVDAISVIDLEHHRIIPFYHIKKENQFIAGIGFAQGWMHILFENSDEVMKLELASGKAEYIHIGQTAVGFRGNFNGDELTMIDDKAKRLVVYHPADETIKEYHFEREDSNEYSSIADCDEFWIAIPLKADSFLRIDKLTKSMTKVDFGGKDIFYSSYARVNVIDTDNDDRLIVMGDKCCFIKLISDNDIEVYNMNIDDKTLAEQYSKLIISAGKADDMLRAMQDKDTEIVQSLELFLKLVAGKTE